MYNIFIRNDLNKINIHLKQLIFECYTRLTISFYCTDKVTNGERIQTARFHTE